MPELFDTLHSLPTDRERHTAAVGVFTRGNDVVVRLHDPDDPERFYGEVIIEIKDEELCLIVKDSDHPDDGDELVLHDFGFDPPGF